MRPGARTEEGGSFLWCDKDLRFAAAGDRREPLVASLVELPDLKTIRKDLRIQNMLRGMLEDYEVSSI
jgi:hypothetical protein